MAGFSSAKFNPIGRILGKNYAIVDPLIASAEKMEKQILSPDMPQVPQTPGTPTVNQALIDKQANDLARRRRGAAATQLAGNTAGASVSSPVLGG